MVELTIEQALQKAIEAHKSQNLEKADRLYTAILKKNPKHPDANHNLGVLALQVGELEKAISLIKLAIDQNKTIDEYWLSYATALVQSNKIAELKDAFADAKSAGIRNLTICEIQSKINVFEEISEEMITSEPEQREMFKDKANDFNVSKAFRLADKKCKENDFDAAKEIYTDILSRFPKNQRALKKLRDLSLSEKCSKDPNEHLKNQLLDVYSKGDFAQLNKLLHQSIKDYPYSPFLQNLFGLSHRALGDDESAIKAFRCAIKSNKHFFVAYNNLGLVYHDCSDYEMAIQLYEKAIHYNPSFAAAYNNLANSYKEVGLRDDAIKNYQKAISINPKYSEAFYNLGTLFQEYGSTALAVENYQLATKYKPNFFQAHNNLGLLLRELGNTNEAIQSFLAAHKSAPNHLDPLYNLANILDNIRFVTANREIEQMLLKILQSSKLVRPKNITHASISLLMCRSEFQDVISLGDAPHYQSVLIEKLRQFTDFHLIIELMKVCPIPDVTIEKFLRFSRKILLTRLSSINPCAKIYEFQSALALQCHTNEFLYTVSDKEKAALNKLVTSIEEDLRVGKQPKAHHVLCVASYKSIIEYPWHAELHLNKALKSVYQRQVTEPIDELKIKAEILASVEIFDATSLKVQKHYEENPYPRWVNLGLTQSAVELSELIDMIDIKVPYENIRNVQNPNVLIAGCGTGQHSITVSQQIKGSNVTAIDLSLSSLAYAKRKTQELNISNIQYLQADILNLNFPENSFDVIESGGVIHHLKDPLAGWSNLVGCLKPGGLMKIGLYSETSRQGIFKLRRSINQSWSNSDSIRALREDVINSEDDLIRSLLSFHDFYSTSELRDLLFHEQETCFTIPQINDHLISLGLTFCGFESRQQQLAFNNFYTSNADKYDLMSWHEFEIQNPKSFSGMYQFWCQKPVENEY